MCKSEYDVVIVGCGVGACVLALKLGRAGKRVLVIEKNAGPSKNGADVLKPPAIRILDQEKILPFLYAQEARARDSLDVYHNGKHVERVDYAREEHFLLVPYHILVQTLLGRLQQTPNVHIAFNTSVVGVEREGTQVRSLQTSSGRHVRATVFVGAEGRNSVMREYAGIRVKPHRYTQELYYAKCALSPSVDEANRLYIGDQNSLAYFYPINHREAMCVVGVEAAEGGKLRQANHWRLQQYLKRFVSKSDDILEKLPSLSGFVGVPVFMSHASIYGVGNIVLLGDAIHTVHPVTGQGMNLAIEDADSLSRAIMGHLSGEVTLPKMNQVYDNERRPVNSAIVDYGHRLALAFNDGSKFTRTLNAKLQSAARAS